MKVFLCPFTGPRSLCSTCMSRRSCGEGIPLPLHRATSLCSTCTIRGSHGEDIPPPLHRAKSQCSPSTSRRSCGDGILMPPITGPSHFLRPGSSRKLTLARGAPQTDRGRQRRVRRRDRWTMSATPRDEDRRRWRERRTRRAGGEEAHWFWRVISESSIDQHTVRVGLVRRLKAVCGRFGPSGRVVS